MKKYLLLIFTFLAITARAQTSVYHPFPDSSASWCGEWGVFNSDASCVLAQYLYQTDGQILINGNTYTRIKHDEVIQYSSSSHFTNCDIPTGTATDTTPLYIRQDTMLKKVWLYNSSSMTDTILYNFDLHVHDPLYGNVYWGTASSDTISSIDSVLINGSYRKRFNYRHYGCVESGTDTSMIEGIGALHGLIKKPGSCDSSRFALLNKFIQNGQVYYGDMSDLTCFALTGINEATDVKSAVLFPNPFHDAAVLRISDAHFSYYNLKIYNNMGALVHEERINHSSAVINRNSLPDGIYFYQLINGGGQIVSGKFIIE